MGYIDALGGAKNIAELNNCATRLRVNVNDENLVANESVFKEIGAYGLVKRGNAVQVIIGGNVVPVRGQMDELMSVMEEDSTQQANTEQVQTEH